jgi:hypothetical protein
MPGAPGGSTEPGGRVGKAKCCSSALLARLPCHPEMKLSDLQYTGLTAGYDLAPDKIARKE